MTITITAFARSPNGGKGLARDTRVRWALEEVGRPYEVRLVSFRAMKEPAHRRFILSARFRPTRKVISPCWRQGRSSSISPSAMWAYCRTMPIRGRARSHYNNNDSSLGQTGAGGPGAITRRKARAGAGIRKWPVNAAANGAPVVNNDTLAAI